MGGVSASRPRLAKKQAPDALPLAAPDGGADTLILAKGQRPKEVVQAKHYPGPGSIKWSDCQASAKAAIDNHQPQRITFGFPRDFTAKEEREFRANIVDVFPEVEIGAWTLSEIIDRLDQHPDLKKRYFGRGREEMLDSVLRAIEHGAKLETGEDLINRARSLADFAEEHDRDFTYGTSAGGASMPEPRWEKLPFMAMTVKNETTTVRVDAWARDRANIPSAGFSFTADEAGAEALARAREELAQDRDAVLRTGVHLQIPKMPKAIKEAMGEGERLETPEIIIRAGSPLAVELTIETDEGAITRTFAARPVPPREPGHVAFACRAGGLLIELDFLALDEPTVEFQFWVTGRFGDDVSTSLDAARVLHAFFTHKRIILRAEGLFPDGVLEDRFETGTEEETRLLEFRRSVYEDLAFIEDQTGHDFKLPERFGEVDLAAINTVARVLRTREGTATFEEADGVVEANEIALIAEQPPEPRVIHRPVIYEVLRERVELGVGEYVLPPLQVVDVKPLGTTPDSPAHVTIRPADGDQMRFHLVGPTPRAA